MISSTNIAKPMMVLKHIRSAFFLAFALIAGVAQAQTTPDLEIDTRSAGSVVVCGNALEFTVIIRNISGSSVTNVRLYPRMPEGMVYVAGSAQNMSEVLPINHADLYFTVGNLPDAEPKTVRFQAKANCGLIETMKATGSTSNLVNNETLVKYNLGGEKELPEPNGSESYSVLYPELELFIPENEKNQAVPFITKTVSRHIGIKNSGLGRLSSLDFYLKSDIELTVEKLELVTASGNQVITSTIHHQTLGKKYTITNFSGTGNGDAYLDENEVLQLVDYVKANTSKGAIETIYTAQWGCLAAVCNADDRQAQFTAYIEAIGGDPSTPRTNVQVLTRTDFCNDPGTVRWSFSNDGSGNTPASKDAGFNVEFFIYQNSPKTTDNHNFYINHSNGTLVPIGELLSYTEFVYNNPPPFPATYQKRYSFNFKDRFTYDPDGAGGLDDVDEDGFYDDFPVGSTVTYTAVLLSSLDLPNEYNLNYGFNANFYYQKWSGQQTGIGIPSYGIGFRALSQKLLNASDLTNGKRETVRFELKEYNSSNLLKTQDAVIKVNVAVPQGVALRAARWNNKDLSFTKAGNTYTIVDPFFQAPMFMNIDFEFELNCAEAVPGVLVDDITVDMLYYFDKNCSTFFKVASASKEMYLHCGTCSSIETTLFTAERTTLGWVQPSFFFHRYGTLYGANPPIVKRDPAQQRLDAAYPKDDMEVIVQGRVAGGTATSLSAEVKYTAPINREVLHFVSASFVLGNTTYNIPAGEISKVVVDSTFKYTFNVPLGQGGLPAQLSSGVFELKVKYKVDALEGVARGEYPLVDFRGQFYTRINGNPTNCLGFGDDFLLLRPAYSSQNVSFTLTEKDQMAISYFRFDAGNDNYNYGIADFPNEFRPIYYPEKQTITLPQGFIFDHTKPVQFSIGTPGSGNIFTFTGATFSTDKRTIIIARNDDLPVINYHYFYFLASVKIDCSTSNLFVPVTTSNDRRTGYRNDHILASNVYLPSPPNHQMSPVTRFDSDVYNYRRPNLQLTANSVQEGYSDKVTWPVQLCNPNSFDRRNSLNTWVAFELKGDDNSTVLQKVLDQDNNAIPETDISYYGPRDAAHPKGRYMMVRLGTIDLTSCVTLKVVATYQNCEDDRLQDVNVFTSWDYNTYPDVSGYTGSIVDRKASCEGFVMTETMSIKYKTADLQWQVRKNGPEEVDLCVATPFEIDLASTKFGDMKQLMVWMQLPPSVTLDAATVPQFNYPFNADAAPIPADAIRQQDGRTGIDISRILGGNLPGIYTNDNKIRLSFSLITSCGFDPGLPIKYTVNGYTNCGDYIETVDQRKIKLNGISAEDLDSLELELAAPQALTCNSDNDMQLRIKNIGSIDTRLNQLEVTLPPGTQFKEMVASGDLPAPVVTTENNRVRLRWTLPAGYLAPDSSEVLTFRTFLSQTPSGTTSVMFTARTYITADGHCADANTACNMQVTSALDELSVPVTGLTTLAITHKRYICAYQFTASTGQVGDCMITSYAWSFGDGGTSREAMPFHSFGAAGTYNVSVNVNFNCGGCSGSQSTQIQLVVTPEEAIWKDTTIEVLTDIKKQVLQVSASTFSDSWPTQHIDPTVDEKHSFLNGTLGVWRNDGAFVYETARKASEPVNVATDGTFTMDQFNWQYADLEAIPGWVKANSMTQYSPYSYELENRDVLGIYSSALYDYGGHLPSANGVNMRNAEMAFTSFEYLDDKSSGNWIFGNQPLPSYYLYNIRSAHGNIAIVEASLKDLDQVVQVDVSAYGFLHFPFFPFRYNYTQNNEIVCKLAYGPNPDWSVVVLKEAPHRGLWKGRMKVTNEILPVITPDIDPLFAHSGTHSLKISAEKTFKQNLLQLDSGKNYLISAWVSVGNPSVPKPELAEIIGIDVVVRNKQGLEKSRFPFAPSGPVIEGWQQIKGTFTYSGEKGATLELMFRPATTGGVARTAWYDDLRLHPEKGNMKSYVYNLKDYRLQAILDEENFASFYFYDAEGNLYLVKKETEKGVKTISENVNSLYERPANR